MMRTVMVQIKPNNPAVPYFRMNTAGSRAVRNTANFLIRNTMTGLSKSPEERTHNETEALHIVFTGIQKANRRSDVKAEELMKLAVSMVHKYGLSGLHARACIYSCWKKIPRRFSYPDREHWFLGYEVLDAVLKETHNEAYYSCISQVNQQALRKTVQAWLAWFRSLKDWKKHPDKYKARPRLPGYIRERETTACFTRQVCKTKEVDGRLYLDFTRYGDLFRIGKPSLLPGKFVRAEVKPFHGRYQLLLTSDDGLEAPEVPENPERILGLDPGVGNFLAGLSNTGALPFLIRGGWLKSLNQCFNKQRARLTSCLDESRQGSRNSRALDALSRDRENKLRDFFYKAAHWVMRWCVENRIQVVVIGHSQWQKQDACMWDQNNQNFVSIPYSRFLFILKVVGYKYRIPVTDREESYTSQASLLDMDKIPTYGQKGADRIVFSGKRKERGLYVSSEGHVVNADINGAGNILRKEYPHAFEGKDLSYIYGAVLSVTGEEILKINPKVLMPYHPVFRHRESKDRHERRKARRVGLMQFFGYSKKGKVKGKP